MRPSVLLTNGQLRKTLSAVRSLGTRGITAFASDTTTFTPAGYSKYCKQRFAYPPPAMDEQAFIQWLLTLTKKHHVGVLFPMDDDTLAAVMNHREEVEEYVRLPLPPTPSYRVAADKGTATQLAAAAGVRCPQTYYPTELTQLAGIADSLVYPVVIKPRHSSGSRGIRVVGDPKELLSEYTAVHALFPFPIVQEYIEQGARYDVCLMYDQAGKRCAAFVQKEVRHFPVERGPSTLQESVEYPELVELAERIMSQLEWKGVVELEFMLDGRTGEPVFMEINPRFWNSLHLAVISGVDFPWMLYQLAVGEPINPVRSYEPGKRCKWLLPGDALHFVTNPKRFAMDPPLWAGRGSGVEDDIWSREDPMPTLGFSLACLRYVTDIKAWKHVFRR